MPPANLVLGGQDPGVYTNVAAQIARTGGIAITDTPYARLRDTPALAQYVADNYTDPFLPGVYTVGDAAPPLVFQFYHLFPAWLAIPMDVFGVPAGGHALVFLGLLSVLLFQRLALQLTGSWRLACAAGVLLATNPLHALFSRIALSEVPTLAFSLAGAWLLARYAMAPPASRQPRWLALSVAAFGCVFFTRITGFMYLPAVLAIGVGPLLLDPDRERARALQRWSLGVLAAYAASVLYGLAWSGPYSARIYSDAFLPLAGPAWPLRLLALAVVVALAWWMIARLPSGPVAGLVRRVVLAGERLLGPALCVLLAYAAWKGWQLGFAADPARFQALQAFPGVVGAGWMSMAHLSLAVLAMYLGPAVLLAVLAVAFGRWPPAGRLLLVVVVGFFAYAAALNWVLPYQPYYGRYLLSELLPYALLLVCCAAAWTRGRATRAGLAAALVLALAGNVLLLVRQAGPAEEAGAHDALAALAAQIGDDDVLLLDGLRRTGLEPKELKSPLSFVFGRHVVTVGHGAIANVGYLRSLDAAFDKVLLATTDDQPPPGFQRIGRHRLLAVGYAPSPWPAGPRRAKLDAVLHLYRMEEPAWAPGRAVSYEPPDSTARSVVGREYPHRLQASGVAGTLLSRTEHGLPAGRYRLLVRGWSDGRGDAMTRVLGPTGEVIAQGQMAAQRSPAGVLETLDVELTQPTEQLEVRVDVGPGSRLALRSYTLTRLQ